jgi:hypothetical protein
MEPTVLVGGALLLLMMLGGKKKAGPSGPLKPGDKPTPLPKDHPKGPSDPLPGGTKKGHLPKGKGYFPPDDMTTTDLWISPDCQAYLAGADYHPWVQGQDAYDWYRDIGLARDGTPIGVQAADLYWEKTGDDEPWNGELFPSHQSTADIFALMVIAEASPLCAETVPRFDQYEYYDDWQTAFHLWLTQYPALGELLVLLIEEAAYGGGPRELQDELGEVRIAPANFVNALEDWGRMIEFGQTGTCPPGMHAVYPEGAEPGMYTCVLD